MEYYKKLVGDRIYLSPREISEEDVKAYTKWMNEFAITDYTNKSFSLLTSNCERGFLENTAKEMNNYSFSIVTLDNDKLIGTVGFVKLDHITRSGTLGIFIGDSDYRSKGYGAEAVNLLLEFGFKYLNLHSVKLDLLSANERAHKCYLKCGFKDTGLSRDAVFVNGKYYDELHMDILESEFNGEYIKNKEIK